jgi:ATP-dependent protease ClpP protease subunit
MSAWEIIKKTVADSAQAESGNIDPARLQYFFAAVCGVVFIWGVIYDTLQNKHFNGTQFAMGAAGIGALIVGAAAGEERHRTPTPAAGYTARTLRTGSNRTYRVRT